MQLSTKSDPRCLGCCSESRIPGGGVGLPLESVLRPSSTAPWPTPTSWSRSPVGIPTGFLRCFVNLSIDKERFAWIAHCGHTFAQFLACKFTLPSITPLDPNARLKRMEDGSAQRASFPPRARVTQRTTAADRRPLQILLSPAQCRAGSTSSPDDDPTDQRSGVDHRALIPDPIRTACAVGSVSQSARHCSVLETQLP